MRSFYFYFCPFLSACTNLEMMKLFMDREDLKINIHLKHFIDNLKYTYDFPLKYVYDREELFEHLNNDPRFIFTKEDLDVIDITDITDELKESLLSHPNYREKCLIKYEQVKIGHMIFIDIGNII